MMDRLVCADGGNPDPTTTARQEAGRSQGPRTRRLGLSAAPGADALFSIVVHGDAVGAETLRASLHDWLADMELVPADHRHHRSVHRLLRAVRDEPRGARPRRGADDGSRQRRAHTGRSRRSPSRGRATRRRGRSGATAQVTARRGFENLSTRQSSVRGAWCLVRPCGPGPRSQTTVADPWTKDSP